MKKIEVVTIGLGYIGLPTSALIASHGTNVLGVDINRKVVDIINKGKIHIVESDLEKIVSETISKGSFRASTKPTSADVYLIVVPTPFKDNYQPDISFVESATKSIIHLLKEDDLFILESTSPVGTTEKIKDLIYSMRADLIDKIHIAYCPERVLPGNVMHELVYNDRVIGGIDEDSTNKAIDFYRKYVKGELYSTNARTAEMCKLVENSSRDVQIAFANELSIICEKANINVLELIELANKHPRVNILKPGCGVGGHCIAVDPYFIISNYKSEAKLMSLSRKINNFKPLWVIEKIKSASLTFQLEHEKKPKVAIMGLAFKPDIDDLRESPAIQIAHAVEELDLIDVFFVEPNIENHENFQIIDFNTAISDCDIIVFLVAHKEFYNLEISKSKAVLDFCGITYS